MKYLAKAIAISLGILGAYSAHGSETQKLIEVVYGEFGAPSLIRGESLLSRQGLAPAEEAQRAISQFGKLFNLQIEDQLELKEIAQEENGDTVVWLQQLYGGMPVSGGELAVNINSQYITSIHGRFYPRIRLNEQAPLSDEALRERLLSALLQKQAMPVQIHPKSKTAVRVDDSGKPHLARIYSIRYVGASGPAAEDIFIDAHDGEIIARISNIHAAAPYQIVNDWDHQCLLAGDDSIAPRTVYSNVPDVYGNAAFSFELMPSWLNPSALGAYGNAKMTVDFYKKLLRRDSYDGRGSDIVSNINIVLGASFNGVLCGIQENAFWVRSTDWGGWNSHQIFYATTISPATRRPYPSLFPQDPNVVAHELTHGYTEFSSNLEYAGESGALNEATSDIMAESVEWSMKRGTKAYVDWIVGGDSYTPGSTANRLLAIAAPRNDGARYFFNPPLNAHNSGVGTSNDSANRYGYRFERNCATSEDWNDYCGVHRNSGIANQWFFLVSRGGQMPRDSMDIRVGVPDFTDGIGIGKAMKIWAAAFLGPNHVTSRANFREARNATILAAERLFPNENGLCSKELLAVVHAWDMVGWTDRPDPAMDLARCAGQQNLVRNGTLENGYVDRRNVANWIASTSVPETRVAPAYFTVIPDPIDESLGAMLGGQLSSTNAIETRISMPWTNSRDNPRAALSFYAKRSLGSDPDDVLTVALSAESALVPSFSYTVPASELSADRYLKISLTIPAAALRQLAGQNAVLKITYQEDAVDSSRVIVDDVGLVFGSN